MSQTEHFHGARHRFARLHIVLAFPAIACTTTLFAAPPKCDSLFPAGGQRSQEISVTAAGNFSNWPTSAWIDREGIRVEPEKEKGKFKVSISDDAAGIYLIRFYDKEGASQLRRFVVDSLKEISEVEPNNELAQATPIAESSIINGRLEKGGEVDGFSFELKAGQTLVASIDANRTFGSPMDAVLQICSSAGFVLAQNDDERGIDPQIAFVAPRDGKYIVRTFAFPLVPNSTINFSGAATYIYRLTLTTHGFVDHALPLSANTTGTSQLFGWNLPKDASSQQSAIGERQNLFVSQPEFASSVEQARTTYAIVTAAKELSREKPQPIEFPVVVSGRIDAKRDEDVFQVTAKKGTKLLIQVESDAIGFLLDPLLQVLDATDKVIGEIDDTNRKRDCLLTQTIPADGVYRIVVRDVHRNGGFRYVYRMTIEEAKPDFTLTLGNDSFVLTPGKPLEIPVTVVRKNGFKGEINVSAVELPDRVQCEIVKSEAKGDSSKAVQLVLQSDASELSSVFRVVGRIDGDTPRERTATFVIAGTNAKNSNAWLTVVAGGK
jgi:Bacterial pre-peptidase C-terminal domain